jgi:hypothetical protein
MPAMKVEFEVYCDECGEGLCNFTTVETDRGGNIKVRIKPCPNCMDKSENKGYDRGYDDSISS